MPSLKENTVSTGTAVQTVVENLIQELSSAQHSLEKANKALVTLPVRLMDSISKSETEQLLDGLSPWISQIQETLSSLSILITALSLLGDQPHSFLQEKSKSGEVQT
jgi:hypothetical protein